MTMGISTLGVSYLEGERGRRRGPKEGFQSTRKGVLRWSTSTPSSRFCTSWWMTLTRPVCRLSADRGRRPPCAAARCSRSPLMGQWQPFASERAFYRYVQRHWRSAFPTLPDRTQFNRLVRRHHGALVACFCSLVEVLNAQRCAFE